MFKDNVEVDSIYDGDDDDKELVALGYQPSFKREFSNLATVRCPSASITFLNCLEISFAFSIMVRTV